jgi:hypothetical protein
VNECLRRSVISPFPSLMRSYLYSYIVMRLSMLADILILKQCVYIDMFKCQFPLFSAVYYKYKRRLFTIACGK